MNVELLTNQLRQPFNPLEIEWRIQQSGLKQDGKPYAMVLAYVQNRAIQDRLDEVCGIDGWQNKFHELSNGAKYCEIGIKINDEWIWKGDGAGETQVEGVKGSFSDAMKRAAYQWGIGRYLYNLPVMWANFHDNGTRKDKIKANRNDKEGKYYRWDAPDLPKWALPNPEIDADTFKAMAEFALNGNLDKVLLKLSRYKLSAKQAKELADMLELKGEFIGDKQAKAVYG